MPNESLEEKSKRKSYANFLKPVTSVGNCQKQSLSIKKPTSNNGIPRVSWTEDEIQSMNIAENLQYALIGKFTYGWPGLDELRKILPK